MSNGERRPPETASREVAEEEPAVGASPETREAHAAGADAEVLATSSAPESATASTPTEASESAGGSPPPGTPPSEGIPPTRGPPGNGSSAGGSGKTPDPFNDKRKLGFHLAVEQLQKIETASLLVLFTATLGIVLVLILYPLFWYFFQVESYQARRAVELLLTLAGAATILALLSKDPHPIILVVGFLIIGALIVPTNDLIRFYILARGSSDEDYRLLNSSPSSAFRESKLDRAEDIATRIYQSLRAGNQVCVLPGRTEAQAIEEIAAILRNQQEIQVYETVRQRGALELLLTLVENSDSDKLVYLYGRDARFTDDLNFLRQEGLIFFVYDDYSTLRVLPPGRELANKVLVSAGGGREGADAEAEETEAPENLIVENEPISYVYTGVGIETHFPLTVAADGSYVISADAIGYGDPVITLYDADGREMHYSDDYGASLNARIVAELEAVTNYSVGLSELRGDNMARIRLSVRAEGVEEQQLGTLSGYRCHLYQAPDANEDEYRPTDGEEDVPSEEAPGDETFDGEEVDPDAANESSGVDEQLDDLFEPADPDVHMEDSIDSGSANPTDTGPTPPVVAPATDSEPLSGSGTEPSSTPELPSDTSDGSAAPVIPPMEAPAAQ